MFKKAKPNNNNNNSKQSQALVIPELKSGDRSNPTTCWPASPACLACSRSMIDAVFKKKGGWCPAKDTQEWLLAPTHMYVEKPHTYTHTHKHIHTGTHKHIHTQIHTMYFSSWKFCICCLLRSVVHTKWLHLLKCKYYWIPTVCETCYVKMSETHKQTAWSHPKEEGISAAKLHRAVRHCQVLSYLGGALSSVHC